MKPFLLKDERLQRRAQRKQDELNIYKEFNVMVSVPGQYKTNVIAYLAKKYGKSEGTIYCIMRRIRMAMRQEEELPAQEEGAQL